MAKGTLGLTLALLTIALAFSTPAKAQDAGRPAIVAGTVKAVIADPTTYAPAALLYQSMMLDWNSSQPLFAHGFVEDNPRYTRNGLSHDIPVSYQAGKRRILRDTFAVVPAMLVNNTASHLIERTLARKYPEHTKAFRVLGVVQRISLSAFVSYRLSASHFQQWQMNQRVARQMGY